MVNKDALNLLQVDTPMAQQADLQPSSTAPDHPKEPQESVWAEGSVSQVKPTALSTSLTIPDIDSFCIGKQIAILPCSMPACVYICLDAWLCIYFHTQARCTFVLTVQLTCLFLVWFSCDCHITCFDYCRYTLTNVKAG